ncbi:hypothetical protein N9C91_02935 [Luminiphilus sp.]|nr:hypothetical protein [Luminiphilus sp.]
MTATGGWVAAPPPPPQAESIPIHTKLMMKRPILVFLFDQGDTVRMTVFEGNANGTGRASKAT